MNKGDKIKERRKSLQLTLKEVATAVGVAEATVQRWESGNIGTIRADRITKLSRVLQLPVEEVTEWFSEEFSGCKKASESGLKNIVMDKTEKSNFLKGFGNQIRQLRTERGLSQEELANRVGYTSDNARSSINKIESGISDPPVSKLRLFSKVLNVSMDQLINWDK